MLFMDQLVSDLVSSWWINWAERMLNLRNLWINQLYSYGHLSVISTYNPIYRMYNPIYNQL